MTSALTRYWVEYSDPKPFSAKLGVGVTAIDEADAVNLVSKELSIRGDIAKVYADIDIRALDQNHVVPNMGAASNRGVWFPLT